MSDATCSFCGKSSHAGMCYKNKEGVSKFACIDDLEKGIKELDEKREFEIKSLQGQKKCYFNIAWVGYCEKPGHPFCDEHSKLKCSVCGEQATQECSIAGSLVCGAPLCEKCQCPYHDEMA